MSDRYEIWEEMTGSAAGYLPATGTNGKPGRIEKPEEDGFDIPAVRRAVGYAVSEVDGVLGIESEYGEVYRTEEDVSPGVWVVVSEDDGIASVRIGVIMEAGSNENELVMQIEDEIETALEIEMGLRPQQIEILIADEMSREEFDAIYTPYRMYH